MLEVPPAYKPCPYYGEPIREAAVVCRFCGQDLAEASDPTPKKPAFTLQHLPLFLLVISAILSTVIHIARPGWISSQGDLVMILL